MSDKLELKDIACYLPYGVKCASNSSCVSTVIGLTKGTANDIARIKPNEGRDYPVPVGSIKPILRPMSDLIKPLPDGTIPIVELAKIEGYVDTSDKDYKLGSYILDTYGVRFNIENDEDDNEYEVFGWGSVNGFGVHYRPSKRIRIVGNQRQLWQYLYAHHFDINNLIGRGLAIDINKIENENARNS